ncbi:helix-turn-helix domain-containing protein [Leeuwenhoekiella sp. MAR_2009_132]|uniref:helix-turn-helix domain-containing protein n=1 Tax=Leeuwenhoekiella sp. MAR_2009_132 TaxID=1392489 RepID=UPI0009DF36DE|nr:helix-turn-helix transcriptional regulator [Leeuwenhoekiella sp. MAR_2009_132]
MRKIGEKIKKVRLKKGLSQENLAESSKVNLRTIQRIENNETNPRNKTLRLIFDVLEIEMIENEKKFQLDKNLIGSIFLTLAIIISSFTVWIRISRGYSGFEKIYTKYDGWNGYTYLNDYHFYNWFLSISAITVGLTVIINSLGFIKNKMKYIIIQVICLSLYLIGLFGWSFRRAFEIRPGLFVIVISTIILIIVYKKNRC